MKYEMHECGREDMSMSWCDCEKRQAGDQKFVDQAFGMEGTNIPPCIARHFGSNET